MATYYISTSGSDAAAGTSEGAAWLTVDKGMNTVAAGDKVWVKADGNYAELVTIDTVGTSTTPIVFEGYTTTPGDGGRATITGSGARANCVANSTVAGTDLFYVFKNFRFTAATQINFLTDGDHITFKNCRFDTAGTTTAHHGIQCRLAAFENCSFDANAGVGCIIDDGGGVFIGCTFYTNGGNGLTCQNFQSTLFGCTFFSNAGHNAKLGGTDVIATVINCTFDGDAKDSDTGISYNGASNVAVVVNTVLYDCAIGLDSPGGNMGERVISRNNLVNANTTAYVNAATFTGEITSAPQFKNEVGGADYTPAVGSPLINAGLNG